MTLFECISAFLAANGSLAAKVAGGFYPGVIPQNRPTLPVCVMRYISGVSQPPTHDSGASPWSQVRIELTFWGKDYKVQEQCALLVSGRTMFAGFNGFLSAPSSGRLCVNSIQGPRDVYSSDTKLVGVQVDILGLLNGDTLS